VELPVKPAKKGQTVIAKRIYLITDGERWLIRRRPEEGMLRGMWEFPGEDAGESGFLSAFTVIRDEAATDYRHVFTHRIWEMKAQLIRVREDKAPEDCCWVSEEELEALALPSAFAPFRVWILARHKGKNVDFESCT
jgi:A/G-specific adenine glycosylase